MTTRKDKRRSLRNNNYKKDNPDNSPEAKKSLGQNFLNDEDALKMIVEAANLQKGDKVLEIGPGTGLLTDKLLEKSEKIICIEKDFRMVDFLTKKYDLNGKEKNEDGIRILQEDILEVNLPQFLKDNNFCDYKVVANIPYYITGKILRLLLETEIQPKQAVLLVQKEVAERVCGKGDSMNILSSAVQYYGDAEMIGIVSREAFSPVPKVDSAVIRVTPFFGKKRESAEKEREFFRTMKSGFSSPRKKLLNNLVLSLNLDKEKLQDIFREFGWDENVRAQNISVDQWKQLRDRIAEE